jgi:hypothetical protein
VQSTEPSGGTGILMARFTGGRVVAAWNNDVSSWNEGAAGPADSHYDGQIASAEDLLIGAYLDHRGAEDTDIHEILICGRDLNLG